MQNKRGQELTVGTLILIVLGVIILVLLVLGYSMGWGNLWERINIFQGGSSLESVIQSCKVAVSSASTFTYCQDFKKVKVDGKIEYVNCEDTRVSSSVGGSLSCTNSAQVIEDKCKALILEVAAVKGKRDCSGVSKVNGQVCESIPNLKDSCEKTIAQCTEYADKTAKVCLTAQCASSNVVPAGEYAQALKAGEVCCKVECTTTTPPVTTP